MQTILKSSQFNHSDKYERIQGVIDYLNDLRGGLFNKAYLDDDLKQYFLDNGTIDNDIWIQPDMEEPVNTSCSILDVNIGEPIIIASNDIYEYADDFDGDEDLDSEIL